MVVYHATEAGTRTEITRKRRSPEYLEKAREIYRQFGEKENELRAGREWSELNNDAKYFSESDSLVEWREKEIAKLDSEYPETEIKEVIEKAPIRIFDKKRLGQNTEGNAGSLGLAGTAYTGFWFNAGGDVSAEGDNVMPLFLKIVNPRDVGTLDDLAGNIAATGRKTAKAAANAYLKTLSGKYDGIVLEDTEFGGISYVAFEPDQIKSAVGNIGTFSENPDIRYSRNAGETGTALDEVRRIADDLAREYKNAPELVVVEKASDLPFDAPDDAKGAYRSGRCYLVSGNIATAEDAKSTFAHEVIGHYGLNGFFGDRLAAELDSILVHNKNVQESARKWIKDNLDLIRDVREKTNGKWTDEQFRLWRKRRAIEEALTDMAEKGQKVTGVKKLVYAIQKVLRAIGLGNLANMLESRTDAEALMALHKAELFVRSGKNIDAATTTDVFASFSRSSPSQDYSRTGVFDATESDDPTAEERAEANRQYDEIEKKYKGTPLWMKAPNGEPTKLTERQWVQVRTPNFKRWFGDWEKAGIRERLEGQEPIPVQSEFTEETARIKKSEAAALLKEPFSVKKNIGEVFVTRNGIRESIGHSRNAAKLDVIPHLKEILEKAEYLDTLNDFDGKDIRNHYFAARIEHAGKTKLVFLRVRKAEGRNNQLYVHDVFVENEIKEKASSETNRRLNNPVRESLRNTDLYKSILQDIYAVDKDTVSKVVDENGEPRVVYHGTTADFDAFDANKTRYGELMADMRAFFFSSSQEVAGSYAGLSYRIGWDSKENEAKFQSMMNEIYLATSKKLTDKKIKEIAKLQRNASDFAKEHNTARIPSQIEGGVVMPVFLKATKPKVYDAKGRSWRRIFPLEGDEGISTNDIVMSLYKGKFFDSL